MSGIVGIIIQLIAGAVGGNAAGAAGKGFSLGTTGNSVVGAIGGVILTQILSQMGIGVPGAAMDATAGAAATTGGLDMGALLTQIIGGGAGGGILTVIAGLIRSKMQG